MWYKISIMKSKSYSNDFQTPCSLKPGGMMWYYQCMNSHYENKSVWQPSYLYNWNPCTWRDRLISLKTLRCQDISFVITDGTRGCHNDNFMWHQWRHSWHRANFRFPSKQALLFWWMTLLFMVTVMVTVYECNGQCGTAGVLVLSSLHIVWELAQHDALPRRLCNVVSCRSCTLDTLNTYKVWSVDS